MYPARLISVNGYATLREGVAASGAARGEVTKNGMFPAAALMYLVGANTIHALRRELTETLGSRFDLRTFHDRFLSYGSIPVSLIRETMLSDPAGE